MELLHCYSNQNSDISRRSKQIKGTEYTYTQTHTQIFNKGAKAIQCRKDISFQQMVLEQLDMHM